MSAEFKAFADRLHREIPLSKHMGVRVDFCSAQEAVLSAPLALNFNHKRTAFGGSLHSLAVLAGWSVVTASLAEVGFKVGYLVIQESQIDYILPVDTDFEAHAKWVSADKKRRFLEGMRRKGLARADVVSAIKCGGKLCARLHARFVAELD